MLSGRASSLKRCDEIVSTWTGGDIVILSAVVLLEDTFERFTMSICKKNVLFFLGVFSVVEVLGFFFLPFACCQSLFLPFLVTLSEGGRGWDG